MKSSNQINRFLFHFDKSSIEIHFCFVWMNCFVIVVVVMQFLLKIESIFLSHLLKAFLGIFIMYTQAFYLRLKWWKEFSNDDHHQTVLCLQFVCMFVYLFIWLSNLIWLLMFEWIIIFNFCIFLCMSYLFIYVWMNEWMKNIINKPNRFLFFLFFWKKKKVS